MSKYSGYMDRVAKFDLTTGKLEDYPWSDKDKELYIGGKMMAAKILYDNLSGKEDALSEENIVVITTGPLTGTGAPSASHFNISTISPMTGLISSTSCGGTFGYYLKKAGFDALVLTGKAPEHSWLDIYNDSFNLHNADYEDVWGKTVSESEQQIQDLLDRDYGCNVRAGILTIGPAGENLVTTAGVFSAERTAGEAGTGAVFGAKNLKGIAVAGNHKVAIANPKKTVELNKKWVEHLRKHPITGALLPERGALGFVNEIQAKNALAVCDFELQSAESLKAETCNKGCLSCPIKCECTVSMGDKTVNDPDFRSLSELGSSVQNVLRWNLELDELGLATDATAKVVAKAIADGTVSASEDEMSALFEDIAYRRGKGEALADAKSEGEKVLELASSNRGGAVVSASYVELLGTLGLDIKALPAKAKAEFIMMVQNLLETVSASGQCEFTAHAIIPAAAVADPKSAVAKSMNSLIGKLGPVLGILAKHPEFLFFPLNSFHHDKEMKAAVGMKMTLGKYIRCGERGIALESYLNGVFGAGEDKKTGEVSLVEDEKLKKAYIAARGFGKEGFATEALLKKLKVKKG